jgi:SET and MYND domain-containing protein
VNQDDRPATVSDHDSLYKLLPVSVEIRSSTISGRGMWMKDKALPGEQRYYFKSSYSLLGAGSIMMSVEPHVVVLSSQYLDSYCSFCCGPATSSGLQRCTKCRTLWYCGAVRAHNLDHVQAIKFMSQVCQNKDWTMHKSECTALQKWASSAPSSELAVPSEAVRCLGRIMWTQKRKGLGSAWVCDRRLSYLRN